jgi:hypothetical protein
MGANRSRIPSPARFSTKQVAAALLSGTESGSLTQRCRATGEEVWHTPDVLAECREHCMYGGRRILGLENVARTVPVRAEARAEAVEEGQELEAGTGELGCCDIVFHWFERAIARF